MSYNEPLLLFNNVSLLAATSMASNITSPAYDVSETTTYNIQAVWSGSTPIGTTQLQASQDGVTYTLIDGSILAVTGNTGSNMYNVQLPAYKWVQLVYTSASGTGTMTATISGKLI